MTPLVHAIIKDSLLPPAKREFRDQCGLVERMIDIHCFDATNISDIAYDIGARAFDSNIPPDEVLSFLPFNNTWIEWRDGAHRIGVMLENLPGEFFRTTFVSGASFSSNMSVGFLRKQPHSFRSPLPGAFGEKEDARCQAAAMVWIYGLLAMINTPRIIGQRQHMPHRGLERDLRRKYPVAGSFPLHGWTEILLRVTPPRDASGEPSREAHLTGRVALHWVRAHLRIRLGKLEFVSAHERGDAALGVKRSRYRLAA